MEPDEIGYVDGNTVVYPFLKGRREHERTRSPEEEVRLWFIKRLVHQYQYSPQKIDIEVTVPRRTPEDRADIVVYRDDALTDTFIVVECKQHGLHEREKLQAIEQGFGNSNSLRACYLGVVCGDDERFYNVRDFPPQERVKNRIPSLPVAYGKAPQYRYSRGGEGWELKKVDLAQLNRRFQRCHDAIWEAGKRDPAQAFDEMSMLMVAKYYDENKTPVGDYYRFQIGTNEDAPMVATRIRRIFQESKEQNPSVFANSTITVSDQIVYQVVEALHDISLKDTDIDAKGRAFETFLKMTFKGQLGQYFTPLQIRDFMVEMVDPDESDFVIDPASGSGGFLLGCIKLVRRKAEARYGDDPMAIYRANLEFSHKHVWGIDINDRIARVAMLGMILNEDGSSNIECNDSLLDLNSFQRSDMFRANRFLVLLTNPPFGGDVFEPRILSNFELGSRGSKKRKRQKTEILMLERCLEFLKPGGRMGIVLPDGILTNSSLAYVRKFVEDRATIAAVVSLPAHTFKPSAEVGVKASLVFLQKKMNSGRMRTDYPIFMAIVENVGYDSTGRDDANQLPEVAEAYIHRGSQSGPIASDPLIFQIYYSDLNHRWDPYHYQPGFTQAMEQLRTISKSMPLQRIGLMTTSLAGGATPKAKGKAYTSEEDGIPFLRIQNVTEAGIDLSNVLYVTRETHDGPLRRSQLRPGDLLLTITGRVGTATVVPESIQEANINQHIVRLRLKKGINPWYVAAFINSELGQALFQRAVTGTTRIALDYVAIREIEIPIPPLALQNEIAGMISEAYKERDMRITEAQQVVTTAKKKVEQALRKE